MCPSRISTQLYWANRQWMGLKDTHVASDSAWSAPGWLFRKTGAARAPTRHAQSGINRNQTRTSIRHADRGEEAHQATLTSVLRARRCAGPGFPFPRISPTNGLTRAGAPIRCFLPLGVPPVSFRSPSSDTHLVAPSDRPHQEVAVLGDGYFAHQLSQRRPFWVAVRLRRDGFRQRGEGAQCTPAGVVGPRAAPDRHLPPPLLRAPSTAPRRLSRPRCPCRVLMWPRAAVFAALGRWPVQSSVPCGTSVPVPFSGGRPALF